MVKFKVVRLCKEEAMSIVPIEARRYNLDGAKELLEQRGFEAAMQGPMLIAKKGFEVTLYASGRMLVSRIESKEKATEAAEAVYDAVEGALEPLAKRS